MAVKEKRVIPLQPVLLKVGLALAISIGGILFTFFRTNRNKPPKSKPSHSTPGKGSHGNSRGELSELKDDDFALQDSSFRKVSSPMSDNSSGGRYSGDRNGYLLPEFNELVNECNTIVTADDTSSRSNRESLVPNVESPREYKCNDHEEHHREIKNLRTMVEFLEERERNLEFQLLEYYGLKEQETAVMELQNRLKLNNMESKLYNLKIESLQSDKRRLEAQVSDYAKVVTELEAAKAKIKVLRKKLRSEAEQNREQILNLQERVMKLQDQEEKVVENDENVGMQLKKRKALDMELEEMKKSNHALKLENSELAQKLEYLQMIATSTLDNEEVQELHKESQRLRRQNEDLKKELEQIQADRSTDIEELVYLRWLNACLRYELRNYQPGPDKTIARDLSKTLSPKSEEKAKQLILEYANKENSGDKAINISDFDSDQWSSSQSNITEEPDDLSSDIHSSKPKVFAKLMRLFKVKDDHCHNQTSTLRLERTASMDDIVNTYCSSSQSGNLSDGLVKSSRTSSRHSIDLQRSYSRGQKSTAGESSNGSRRASIDGSLNIFRTIGSITEDENDGIEARRDAQNDLMKYAEALKKSRGKSSVRRKSAAFSSF